MSKSKRLVELMMVVNRKQKFTTKELADEFGVSTRTILRDLQELGELGVPLYSEVGPHGGYRVLNNRVLPPISFTEDEATAVFFAIHALRHLNSTPFGEEFSSVSNKFYFLMPEDVRQRIDQMHDRVEFVTPIRRAESQFLRVLLEAAIQQCVIRIDYDARAGSSSREIQPLGIYARNGLWYCPAYCFQRQDFRVFRCDRMRSATLSSTAPINLRHVHLNNRQSVLHVDQQCMDLYVDLSPEGIERCETEMWPTSVRLHVRKDKTGWMDGCLPRQDVRFFAKFFLGLGSDATIIRPPELLDVIRQYLSELIKQYG